MQSAIRLEGLQTEGRNPSSSNIDQVGTLQLCQIINDEDATIAAAVQKSLPTIAHVIDELEPLVRNRGRVVYVGAGTSGRLGVLDASELPPTFSAPSEQFVALIAGGDGALRHAQEGAEDDAAAARKDLEALKLDPRLDSLVGIAASGRTPYVLSCLEFAKSLGCITIGIACCSPSAMSSSGNVDHMISVITGPEVVTGSTRMKAGTATKLVLNILSTGLMVRVGKTHGNMMIDVKATNKKLQQRSRNIIRTVCGSSTPDSDNELDNLLEECGGSVKLAVASIILQTSTDEASKRLDAAQGVLAEVLKTKHTPLTAPKRDHESCGGFVLCVDGGGSKCAAVVLGSNGEEGRGEAGECNVSSVGINNAVASISLAAQRAVDSCTTTRGKPFQSIPFEAIWVGLAGYDRPKVSDLVNSALVKLFNRLINKDLRVSTDLELLVTPSVNQHRLNSVVALVVGTGSVAMSYRRNESHFIRTGRSGGWGNLLGDDGSGYGLGREGLRVALKAADEVNLRQQSGQTKQEVNPLAEKIFRHFELERKPGTSINLLDRILLGDHGDHQDASTMKREVAEVSRVVLEEASDNEEAKAIVEAGCESLVRIVNLLIRNGQVDPSSSALILSGGLMQNEMYRGMVLEGLLSSGQQFRHIQAVGQPAINAARYLQSNM